MSGRTLLARAVIVTVPMNTLGRIEFSPALSQAKQAAAREKHANRSTKVWYKLKQPIGLWQGLAPWPNPISLTFVDHEEPDGPVLVSTRHRAAKQPGPALDASPCSRGRPARSTRRIVAGLLRFKPVRNAIRIFQQSARSQRTGRRRSGRGGAA